MKFLPLILAAIICSSAFATSDTDCAPFVNNQTGCNGTDGCHFNPTATTCESNCSSLSAKDCVGNNKCQNAQTCGPAFTKCDQANNKNAVDCSTLSGTCKYTPAVGTCTLKTQVQTDCAAITVPANCTGNCTQSPDVFTCAYVESKCSSQQQAQCDANFCTYAPTQCTSQGDCSKDTTTQQLCEAQKGCSWDGTACGVTANCKDASKCPTDVCTPSVFTCSDNKTKGTTTCSGYTKDQCTTQSTFCLGSTVPGKCNAKTGLCVFTESGSSCNETVCDKVVTTKSVCANKSDCPATANPDCGTDCVATSQYTCVANDANKCPTTDVQATCEAAPLYCHIKVAGTCSALSTFSNILAISSLITFLALFML